jgi:DNA polymerase-4
MDAFFSSVEQLDDPSLKGKPVLVGGSKKRGVVAAASYEARPMGVHSAMPMAVALRLCPHAVVVRPRHHRYLEVSEEVFALFHRFTPLVEGLSLDEAFLDVTDSQALFGDAVSIGRQIKQAIREQIHLTASAGIASCKFVAKIASDLNKPDGMTVVPDDVRAFLAPLSIERMWGVGKVAAKRLHDAGFETIGDLAKADGAVLERLLGSWGPQVARLARGIDDRPVVPERAAKSIGAEVTFENDITNRRDLDRHMLQQAARVAERLTKNQLCAYVITVKLKDSNFKLITRQKRLHEPVMDTDNIFKEARALVDGFPMEGKRFRLIGVAASELLSGLPPPTLFPDQRADRRRRLQQVTTELHDRFGTKGLTRAALLEEGDDNDE